MGLLAKAAEAHLRALAAEQADEGGLAGGGIAAGILADRCRVARVVEQVVADLEGEAERFRISADRPALGRGGAAEDAAGVGREGDERPGLERLEADDAGLV